VTICHVEIAIAIHYYECTTKDMKMPKSAQQMRTFQGWPILSAGFRPFYLAASVWSAIMVPLWIWIYTGGGTHALHIDVSWHAHEMLFGYLAGVIAGFLLTAIPNWTGRLPVTGTPLAVLFATWCAGRAAMLNPFWANPAIGWIDCLFLVVFAGVVWREILAGANWRNLPIAIMVTLLALANIAFHAGETQITIRLALAVVLTLIGLIGGRIIPSFTTNWLKKRGMAIMPPAFNRFDLGVLVATAMALLLWAFAPGLIWTGSALLLSGLLNGWRLSRWRGMATLSEALVWILHAGYAWLVAGLLLLGLSSIGQAFGAIHVVPMQAGLHALTAGAIGVMTLAVMTRSSLGHTGRALTADTATWVIYILVNIAALVRVLSALMLQYYIPGLIVSAALWMLAFSGFVIVYGHKLLSPRTRA
jgi:uncharacterized protein involved in response to NO